MEKNLKFLETFTVDEFKTLKSVGKIEVLKNGHTGKSFMAFGKETGKVSNKVLSGELTKPMVSKVCSIDTGETFYMLHQKGEGGATLLGTL